MITSSILNSITFKNVALSEKPNMWNRLHINRSQGNSKVIPYYQKFDKDHVVYLQFGSDSPDAITLKAYEGITEIESFTGSYDSHYGTADNRYYTNFVVTLDSAYYDKKVYFKATQGANVLTSEPVYIYDLTSEIAKGTVKYVKYTNIARVESDLDDRFIDWSVLASTGNYMDFFIDAVDIDPNETDESEVLEGSQSKTILSAAYYSGKVLKTSPVPDYMIARLGVASNLDTFTVNGIQFVKSGEVSPERFGSSTLYQVSIKLTQRNALGINVDRLDLITGTITSQTNCSAHGESDGSVTVAGAAGSSPYEYSIGGAYQSSGTFSGLAAGNYTVTVKDSNGITCMVAVTITQPPISTLTGPEALPGTNVTVAGFTANWNPVTGATGYRLDVAIDSGFNTMVGVYDNLDVSTVTTYNITDLDGRANYYYRVRAIVGGYTSLDSATITVSPVIDSPVPRLASSITGTSFIASWDNGTLGTHVLGATGYRLDVSEEDDFGSFVTNYENKDVGAVLLDEVTGLTVGKTYYYRVRAYNDYQTSVSSSVISQLMVAPPSDPIATGATSIDSDSFSANWQKSAGAAGYFLQVSTDINFSTFVFNQDVGDVATYPVPSLTSETLYFYRVRAYNSLAVPVLSGYSNVILVKTLMAAVVASYPTNIYSQGATLQWTAKQSATKYFLDVATDEEFTSKVVDNQDLGNVLTYAVTGLVANTTYWYRIRAYNGIDYSEYSTAVTFATAQAPAVPVIGTTTFILSGGFTVNWLAATNSTGYQLDVATNIDFAAEHKVPGFDNKEELGLSDNVTGLDPLTTYYVRVRSHDDHEIYSAYSDIATIATLGLVPNPPVATAATSIGTTGFTANWGASLGATGYKLYVSLFYDFSVNVTGFDGLDVGNVVTYPVTGLLSGHGYYYRVAAYNAVGDGSQGNSITAYTNALPLPTIVISPSSWNFPGVNVNKVISVTITNATTWSIDWPSASGFIHEYSKDTNTVTLYYTGGPNTGDSVNFRATGPGGTVTTQFQGRRT